MRSWELKRISIAKRNGKVCIIMVKSQHPYKPFKTELYRKQY